MATSDSPLSITASAGLSVAMQSLQVPGAPVFTVSVTSNSATAVVSNGNGADSYQVSLNNVDWTNGLTIGGLSASSPGTLYCRGVNAAGPGPSSSQPFTTSSAGSMVTIFSDDFESGDLLSTANGFQWLGGQANTGIIPAVTTTNPKNGTRSLEFTYVQKLSTDESWSEQPFNLGALYKRVVREFDIYIPDGSEPWGTAAWSHNIGDGSSNNRKTDRLWGSDPAKGTSGINSYNSPEKVGYEWYVRSGGGSRLVSLHASTGEMGPSGPNRVHDDFITPADLGTWINVKLDSQMPSGVGTADGFNRAYKNGVLVVDNPIDNYSSDPSADHAWQHGYLLGYFNQSPPSNLIVHIDNVVFKGVPK